MTSLNTAQLDRAAGVLLASAAGDALGVPYEFGVRLLAEGTPAQMLGGGLGDFAPGEWSDDTSMAAAIAQVAATGADLTCDIALNAIATSFLTWFDADPPDIGNQTRAVLGATRVRVRSGEDNVGIVMREESANFTALHTHSAGNGALMRTAPVALAHLHNRDQLAEAARAVAALTHANPLAGDSCILWCEAIRLAVLSETIDIRAGLDLVPGERRDQWAQWIDDAHNSDPKSFTPNGFTVTALQAAAAAVVQTREPDDAAQVHLHDALQSAVAIGDDTDTVAAIAGGLLGARWGANAVPAQWRQALHGWPEINGRISGERELVSWATLAVQGGNAQP